MVKREKVLPREQAPAAPPRDREVEAIRTMQEAVDTLGTCDAVERAITYVAHRNVRNCVGLAYLGPEDEDYQGPRPCQANTVVETAGGPPPVGGIFAYLDLVRRLREEAARGRQFAVPASKVMPGQPAA